VNQFDLFAEPAAGPIEAPAPARQAVPQPPAIVKEGTVLPENPLGLRPLKTVGADWLEVKITDAELDAEMPKHPGASDQYVMLQMLVARGVRIEKPCDNLQTDYLYEYVAAPCVIRKQTEPGFAITCWQAPANHRGST
jgi:hypothetical protein